MTDSETVFLNREQLRILLNAAKEKSYRDYCIIKVGITLMLRRHEISDMKMKNFIRENGDIKLRLPRTKSQCIQFVDVPNDIYKLVKRCDGFYNQYSCLWPSLSNRNAGERITPDAINKMVKRTAQRAGLPKQVNSSTLRHSGATIAYKNGASLGDVQKALRHDSLESTAIYLHCEIESRQAATELVNL